MQTILGNELRKKRTEAKQSLRRTASFIGCTAPYLHRIEAGASAPTDIIFLRKLAVALMLNDIEQAKFIEYAYESQRVIRLPRETSAEVLRTINRAARNLEKLENEDLQMIEQILNNACQKWKEQKI